MVRNNYPTRRELKPYSSEQVQKNYHWSRLTFLLRFCFSLFWNNWEFFAPEPSINIIAILFTSVEAPTFLSFSIYFSLNSYICILILSSVTVKEEGDITELGSGDTWWYMVRRVRQMVTVSSFLQFLPEPKLQSLRGAGLLFSSITPISENTALRERCITLQPAGNLWGASLPYPASL